MSARNRKKDTFINFLYRYRFLLSAIAAIALHTLAVFSRLGVGSFDPMLILFFAFPADGLVLFFMTRIIADNIKATWRKVFLCLGFTLLFYLIIVFFVALDDFLFFPENAWGIRRYLSCVSDHLFKNTSDMDMYILFPNFYFICCLLFMLFNDIIDSFFGVFEKFINWLHDTFYEEDFLYDEDEDDDEVGDDEYTDEEKEKRFNRLLEILSSENSETIETERLEIYPMTPDNQEEYALIMSHDKDSYTTNPEFRFVHYLEQAKYVYKKTSLGASFIWIVSLKNGPSIGTIELYETKTAQYDITVNIHDRYINEDYMQEAVEKTISYLFCQKITARITGDYTEKRSLFEKLGFTYDGTIKNLFFFADKYYDLHVYSLYKPARPEKTPESVPETAPEDAKEQPAE